ncbi:MAG: hypothetical protein H6721_09645 [Sandaracinus sp.]|nr:hypothetical protein [Sandaracinus sp.]MCB9632377.1 hypothetical protein [Sandaracinus sp.]
MRFLRLGILVSFAVLLAACATHTMRRDTGPRSFTADDYESIYRAWTRDADDFAWGSMDDVLHATATYESWEFRWAYVIRYARDHSLDDASRDTMLRATLDDTRSHHRFFVTLSGPEFREQDLSSERSAWRVMLVDEAGRQVAPVEVRKVRRASAAERVYFPSINPHRQVFRLTFPARHEDGAPTIPEDASSFRLRFAGARGQVDLEWRFDQE